MLTRHFVLGDQAYRLVGALEDPGRLEVLRISQSAASETPGVPMFASDAETQSVDCELNYGSEEDDPEDHLTHFATVRTELEIALCGTIAAAAWTSRRA